MVLKNLCIRLPESYVQAIDELVREGKFTSRSEAVRTAIRELLKREFWRDV